MMCAKCKCETTVKYNIYQKPISNCCNAPVISSAIAQYFPKPVSERDELISALITLAKHWPIGFQEQFPEIADLISRVECRPFTDVIMEDGK